MNSYKKVESMIRILNREIDLHPTCKVPGEMVAMLARMVGHFVEFCQPERENPVMDSMAREVEARVMNWWVGAERHKQDEPDVETVQSQTEAESFTLKNIMEAESIIREQAGKPPTSGHDTPAGGFPLPYKGSMTDMSGRIDRLIEEFESLLIQRLEDRRRLDRTTAESERAHVRLDAEINIRVAMQKAITLRERNVDAAFEGAATDRGKLHERLQDHEKGIARLERVTEKGTEAAHRRIDGMEKKWIATSEALERLVDGHDFRLTRSERRFHQTKSVANLHTNAIAGLQEGLQAVKEQYPDRGGKPHRCRAPGEIVIEEPGRVPPTLDERYPNLNSVLKAAAGIDGQPLGIHHSGDGCPNVSEGRPLPFGEQAILNSEERLRLAKDPPCPFCDDTGWQRSVTGACPACNPLKALDRETGEKP